MGRFMSPDWSKTPDAVPYADLANPQSLNLYSYAGNNPLSRTDPDGHCWGWIQGACDLLQKLGDEIAGDGWKTFAQVRDDHRQFVLGKQKTDSEKNAVKNATDAQIKSMYRYYTDPVYNAQVNSWLSQVVVALPDGFSRDGTGKIHGDLPDRIPDNWSRAQLEEARDELQASIQKRIEATQDFGGPDAGHMSRIR